MSTLWPSVVDRNRLDSQEARTMQPILGHIPRAASRRAALVAAALLAAPSVTFAQLDNFNDGDDVGWTRYDPFVTFGAPATYSFPEVPPPEGNIAYQIVSQVAPNPPGPGVIG